MLRAVLGLKQVIAANAHSTQSEDPVEAAQATRAGACLPLRRAQIAKLVSASARHVETTVVALDKLAAARASLPAARLTEDERFPQPFIDLAARAAVVGGFIACCARRGAAVLAGLRRRSRLAWTHKFTALSVGAVETDRSAVLDDLAFV